MEKFPLSWGSMSPLSFAFMSRTEDPLATISIVYPAVRQLFRDEVSTGHPKMGIR
jgi:hypothetical protein